MQQQTISTLITPLLNVFFCVLFSAQTFSTELYKRFGIDDGLPNATIYSVTQDERGFIWLGSTNSGLLRFDGYKFTEFPILPPIEAATQQVPDVGVILIDSSQSIWAGTWGVGLSKIDSNSAQLHRFTVENGLAGNQIQALLEDQQHYIWVGTTTGLSRISPQGEISIVAPLTAENPLADQRVWSLSQSSDGTVWIGTSAGLHYWRPASGLSPVLQVVPGADSFSRDNEIRALLENDQQIWIGTRNGLYSLDVNTLQFDALPLPQPDMAQPIVNVLSTTGNGVLLMGSYNGLFRVDMRKRRYIVNNTLNALPNVNIRAIKEDNSGVLWLGTRESGLYRSVIASAAFDTIDALSDISELTDSHFSVTSLLRTDNALWLGGVDKAYRLDLTTNSMQTFSIGSRINAFAVDPEQNLFLATDKGLYRYLDSQTLQKLDTPFTLASMTNRNVRDLVIDKFGTFYLGLWGEGVIAWQPGNDQVKHWLPELALRDIGNAVQSIFVSDDRQLWVGTRYSGLFQIDLATSAVLQHSTELQQHMQLPHNEVHCVRQQQDLLAVCTKQGLVLINRMLGTQQLFTTDNGLADNNVLGVLLRPDRQLWALTTKGLSLLPAGETRFIHYNSNDGMVATELNQNAVTADSTYLYFGSINGVVVVRPELLQSNHHMPQPVLSALTIDHQLHQLMPFQQEWPDITLSPQQRTINFEFSALDYQDPQRNQFLYKLQGIDQDWVQAQQRNSAFYANLPPGEYALWLKASNNHGLFSSPVQVARLIVTPQWWQHAWIIYVSIFVVTAIFWLVHRYRLRHIRQVNRLLQSAIEAKAKSQLILETRVTERTQALEENSVTLSLRTKQLEKSLAELASKNTELKRLDKLKDEFIATVSHELRTPLTAIRGAIGLISQNIVTPGTELYSTMVHTAQSNSERLAQLINDLLDLQKFTAGTFTLTITTVDLCQLAEQSVKAMQPYAQRYQVLLDLQLETQEPLWIEADALRIRQVIDNLISNAIKFSPKQGSVTVTIQTEQAAVRLQVEDHGAGIPLSFQPRIFEKFSQADGSDSRAKDGTGLGLAICKKIIDNHQGQIGFTSQPAFGSKFWFRLMLAKPPQPILK